MSLDISKLEGVKEKYSHIIARCPACAEQGHDRKGNHLSIDKQGRFACVLYPEEGGKEHRKRIFKLTGIKENMKKSIKIKVPQYKLNQNKTTLFADSDNRNLGRLGRVNHTRVQSNVICKDILGRLGRLFVTPTHIEQKYIYKKEYDIGVPAVPNETEISDTWQLMQKDKESESEALNERMAIMGENCEPNQTEPYVTGFGVLVIPFNSDKKYHYWNGGQSVCDTLKGLGRCALVGKYKSLYSN